MRQFSEKNSTKLGYYPIKYNWFSSKNGAHLMWFSKINWLPVTPTIKLYEPRYGFSPLHRLDDNDGMYCWQKICVRKDYTNRITCKGLDSLLSRSSPCSKKTKKMDRHKRGIVVDPSLLNLSSNWCHFCLKNLSTWVLLHIFWLWIYS